MNQERVRAKSKRIQKLGRDGLVEQDKATGEECRVSQRTADVSFGPDHTTDQGLAQRAPAKGRKRRQPPPPPEGHSIHKAEPSPAMWEVDGVSVAAPPLAGGSGQSRKRRQGKQAQRMRPCLSRLAPRTVGGCTLRMRANSPPRIISPGRSGPISALRMRRPAPRMWAVGQTSRRPHTVSRSNMNGRSGRWNSPGGGWNVSRPSCL